MTVSLSQMFFFSLICDLRVRVNDYLYVPEHVQNLLEMRKSVKKLNFQNVNIRHFLQVMYSLSQLSKKG